MNKGWVKIYRSIQDNPMWFCEPFTKSQAWIDIILIANHKENSFYVRGNEIVVNRGQFAYGEVELSKRWKWSRNKVRRYLNWLETIQQIKQQKNRLLSIYTVLNYESYQVSDTSNDTTDDTTERQQKVQQKDINKNVKKEKNVKNINYGKPIFEERKTGMLSIGTIIEGKKLIVPQMGLTINGETGDAVIKIPKKSGINHEWQDKAFRYAHELNITLEAKDKGRWMKMFKQASEGRKSANLEQAYSFIADYPKQLTSVQKMLFFFKIYENGKSWMKNNAQLYD